MDIQTMRIFQTVAKEGSFSAAAHQLNYAQSNISIKMQQLESDMHSALFYRHNRGITLTPKGSILLQYAEKILNLLDETSSVMLEDGIARGPLAIGSMETVASIYLPNILAKYHKNYPEVALSLQTRTTPANIELLLSHDIDLAFVTGPVNHPDLEQIPFKTEDLVLVTGKAQKDINSWKDMSNRTLLVFPYGCTYRKTLEQLLLHEGITPERIIEFNSLSAMIPSICAGLGMSLLPSSVVDFYIKENIMTAYPIPAIYSAIPTVITYRKDHFKNAAFTSFLESTVKS
ncbi:MAG: LysR family transcriptional regulator [Clostridia bacterium]|nr:LysR family transcriptional regulator [Clostridia bacterium]